MKGQHRKEPNFAKFEKKYNQIMDVMQLRYEKNPTGFYYNHLRLRAETETKPIAIGIVSSLLLIIVIQACMQKISEVISVLYKIQTMQVEENSQQLQAIVNALTPQIWFCIFVIICIAVFLVRYFYHLIRDKIDFYLEEDLLNKMDDDRQNKQVV